MKNSIVVFLVVVILSGCEWTGEFSGELRDSITAKPLCGARVPYAKDLEVTSDGLGFISFSRDNQDVEEFEVIKAGYVVEEFKLKDEEHKLVYVTPITAGSVSYVELADLTFSNCIRQSNICYSEVQSLSCDNQGISSVIGVENLGALTGLTLVGNNLTELSSLINHTSLITIDITGNNNVTCVQLNELIAAKGSSNVLPSSSDVGVNCQ